MPERGETTLEVAVTEVSGTITIACDGIGNRVSQTKGNTTTRYALDVAAGLMEVIAATAGTSTSQFVQVGGQVLAQHDSGAWAYVLPDHLGSVRQLTNAAAWVTLAKSYQPFGSTMSSVGSTASPFGFTGEQADATGALHNTSLLDGSAHFADTAAGLAYFGRRIRGAANDCLTLLPAPRPVSVLRKSPGVASGGHNLPHVTRNWLRGSDFNAGVTPKQIAD